MKASQNAVSLSYVGGAELFRMRSFLQRFRASCRLSVLRLELRTRRDHVQLEGN